MTEETVTRRKPIKRKFLLDDIDLAVLIELGKTPPATYREIAAVIGRSHMTARQRVEWLAESGLVKRAEGKKKGDARSMVLTKEGKLTVSRGYV